jgi:hypothetical protein
MREIRQYGSEGGAGSIPCSYLYVRLKASVHRRAKIPLWRSLTPVTESNCAPVRRRGEQLEVKG